jgi:hypothetical protein
MTGSLVTVMDREIPVAAADCSGDACADDVLCLWIVTTAGRRLYADPLTVFEAPVFHPFRHALAFSESMLSAGLFTGLVERATGNPVLAYDLYYLASIVLSVVGMFLFVREITDDARAALVAGALFGLATERQLFWGFAPALAVHWAPLVLYAWVRFVAAPSRTRGVVLGLLVLLHMHSGAYHGLMLMALVVPWALVLALAGPWPRRRWTASLIPLGLAGAAGAALYLPYVAVRHELQYQAAGLGIALPTQYWNALAHPLDYAASRVSAEPGGFDVSPLAWLVLAAAGLAIGLRPRPLRAAPAGQGVHLAAALLLAVLAMGVSLGDVIMTPLGLLPGPLALLRLVPGFGSMRAVVRFFVLAAFARAIVAGIALAVVHRRLPSWAASAVSAVVLVLALVDARLGDARPTYDTTVPAEWARGYAWLRGTVPDTAVLEMPYGGFMGDARFMVYALSHGRRLMNGYSAVMPRFLDIVAHLPEDDALRTLDAAGVRFVVIHPSLFEPYPVAAAHLRRLRARRELIVAELDDTLILSVPAPPTASEPPLGTPLPRDAWRVEGSAPGVERAVDGDPKTHWVASSVEADAELRVDMGAAARVTDVVLDLGPHVLEYPRHYELRASDDGVTWRTIGAEDPTAPPFASYRRDHLRVSLRLRVAPTTARWLAVHVSQYPPDYWVLGDGTWAVHELRVFGEPASTPTSGLAGPHG